jgi:alkanesulfonate monooxygenase
MPMNSTVMDAPVTAEAVLPSISINKRDYEEEDGQSSPGRPETPTSWSEHVAIEFIGSLVNGSLRTSASGGPVSGLAADPDYPARMADLHEESGFDRLLVGHSSSSPDGFSVADQVLTATSRLGVLLAHRPGFVAPTVAARQYATLEAFHPGRVAMHVITGGDDTDQLRDGDACDKEARYRRSDEFLQVVKLEWGSQEPFDYDGEFYRVARGLSAVRPPGGTLPVYFAGASDDAVRVGGRHADVYAFWGEPLAAIAARIAAVRAAALPYGREPRFSVSLRPIAAATEAAAWQRAYRILEIEQSRGGAMIDPRGSEGSMRLRRLADQAQVHDKRLWTPLARTPTAGGNSTALVGSYEQIAESLLDYIGLGVSTLLIRGYDPEADAADYATIIKLVREQSLSAAATPPGRG